MFIAFIAGVVIGSIITLFLHCCLILLKDGDKK